MELEIMMHRTADPYVPSSRVVNVARQNERLMGLSVTAKTVRSLVTMPATAQIHAPRTAKDLGRIRDDWGLAGGEELGVAIRIPAGTIALPGHKDSSGVLGRVSLRL